MKLKPHLLGILVILLTALIIFFYFSTRLLNKSTFTLDSKENKFTISLRLKEKQKKDLFEILDQLSIPQNVLNGINFQLDATSSAALVYLTPITADIKINNYSINFNGHISHSPFDQTLSEEFVKAPKSSNLIMFAPNLLDFILTGRTPTTRFGESIIKKTNYPQNLINWFKLNFNDKNGQYLFVFGKNADFALLTKKDNINLYALEDIKVNEQDPSQYKEETRSNINYHLLNIAQSQNESSQTLTFFLNGKWTIFASSREAAFDVSDSLNSESDFIEFPNHNIDTDTQLAVFVLNEDKYPINQNSINFMLGEEFNAQKNNQKIINTIDAIERIQLILKGDKFSGLIKV